MRALIVMSVCVLVCCSGLAAQDGGDPKREREDGKARIQPMREQNADLITAIDRLKKEPQPGEVKNGGVAANIEDVYGLKPEEKASLTQVLDAYNAALLDKADK